MSYAIAWLVLFTRLDARAVLEHELRKRILDQLGETPGLTVGALSTKFEVDYKTALYHVRVLQRGGYLVAAKEGRISRIYLPGRIPPKPQDGRFEAALRAIADGAGTPAALSRALDIPRGTAGSLIAALKQKGLLR